MKKSLSMTGVWVWKAAAAAVSVVLVAPTHSAFADTYTVSSAPASGADARAELSAAAASTRDLWARGGSSSTRTLFDGVQRASYQVAHKNGEAGRSVAFSFKATEKRFDSVFFGPLYAPTGQVVSSMGQFLDGGTSEAFRSAQRVGVRKLRSAKLWDVGFVRTPFKMVHSWPVTGFVPTSAREASEFASNVVSGGLNPGVRVAQLLEFSAAVTRTDTPEGVRYSGVYAATSWSALVSGGQVREVVSEVDAGGTSLREEVTVRFLGSHVPMPVPVASVAGTRVQKVLRGVFVRQRAAQVAQDAQYVAGIANVRDVVRVRDVRRVARGDEMVRAVNVPGGVCVTSSDRAAAKWGAPSVRVVVKNDRAVTRPVSPTPCR